MLRYSRSVCPSPLQSIKYCCAPPSSLYVSSRSPPWDICAVYRGRFLTIIVFYASTAPPLREKMDDNIFTLFVAVYDIEFRDYVWLARISPAH